MPKHYLFSTVWGKVIRGIDGVAYVIMITGYVKSKNAIKSVALGADTIPFKPLENFTPFKNALDHAAENIQRYNTITKHTTHITGT